MRDFKRGGRFHWSLNGHAPCGAFRLPTADEGLVTRDEERRLAGREPMFATPCDVCTPVREAYFKFLRNGGSMQGWDICPNPDREDAA
jgi:hypothetical protein